MLEILKGLHFKRDPRLIIFAIMLVLAVAGLIAHGDLTAKEGMIFLGSALALPGLFGSKSSDDPTTGVPANSIRDKGTILPPADLPRVAIATIAICLAGCGWLKSHSPELVDILADRTKCVLQNMNLPTEQVITHCAVPADLIPKILPLLESAREEAAREAAGARLDERAQCR